MPKVIIPQDNGDLISQTLKQNPGAAVYGDSGNMGVNKGIANFYSTPSSFNSNIVQGRQVPIYGNSPDYYKDMYSEDQGWVNKLFHGVGRAATVLGFEVAKMVPGIIGLGAAGLGNIGDLISGEDNFDGMSWINNKAVQWLDEKEQAAKENPYLAIYSNSAYDKMNWTEKLSKVDFWATQGADGIGFMASMFVPGTLLKGLGIIGRGAGAFAKLGQSTELLGLGRKVATTLNEGLMAGKIGLGATEAEKIAYAATALGTDASELAGAYEAYNAGKVLNKSLIAPMRWMKPAWNVENGTNKSAKAWDMIATSGANGIFESASEANESMNTLKLQLENDRSKGLNQFTDEQIQEKASNAAATTFKYNLPLLLASNMVLESVILNKFENVLGIGKRTAMEAEEEAVRLIRGYNTIKPTGKLSDYLSQNLTKFGMKDFSKEIGYKLPLGMIKEGLFEEGFQNSIQRYAKDAALKSKGTSIMEDFSGIYNQYKTSISDLGDNEFWESVALGAALGGFGEAGIGNAAKTMINGGFDNLDYNRRIFGGEAQEPSKAMQLLGAKKKEKTEGVISQVQQLMEMGFNQAESKDFFELDDKGAIVFDVNNEPVMKKDKVNTFLATSIFRTGYLEDLDRQITQLQSAKINEDGSEKEQIINSQIDTRIKNLEANKKMINDMVMFDHFSHLFDLGLAADEMSGIVVDNLVNRQKAQLQSENPLMSDAEVNEKLKGFRESLNSDIKNYKQKYDYIKNIDKYDAFFRPSPADSDLYRQFKQKNMATITSHLFFKQHKLDSIEYGKDRINKLEKVKQGFEELDTTLKSLYDTLEESNTNSPEMNSFIKNFKSQYTNLSDDKLDGMFRAKVEEELRQEAIDEYKNFGIEKPKFDGKEVSEEEYIKGYIEHANTNRPTINQGKKGKTPSKGKTETESRIANRTVQAKSVLLSLLSNKPELFASIPNLSNIKELVDRIGKYSDGTDFIKYLDKQIEDIEDQNEDIQKEIDKSGFFFRKAIRSELVRERFEDYKKKLKEYEDAKTSENENLNNLISMIEASGYISDTDRRNYKRLSENTNRTAEENKLFNALEAKLLTANGKERTEDYKVIDGRIFVTREANGSILLNVKDSWNLDALTKEQQKEYKNLLKKTDKTTSETQRLADLSAMIPNTTIFLRTSSWNDKETGELRFKTRVTYVKDTGKAFETTAIRMKFGNEWGDLSVNNKSFFSRFNVTQVLERNSPEANYFRMRGKYYAALNKRINRIIAIQRRVDGLSREIDKNTATASTLITIADTLKSLSNTKLQAEYDAREADIVKRRDEELAKWKNKELKKVRKKDILAKYQVELNRLNELRNQPANEMLVSIEDTLDQLELDLGILNFKSIRKTIKSLEKRTWIKVDKKNVPQTIGQVLALTDLSQEEKALINFFIDELAKDGIDYTSHPLHLALSQYDKYVNKEFTKKGKAFYLLQDIRDNLKNRTKTVETRVTDEGVEEITTLTKDNINIVLNNLIQLVETNLEDINTDINNIKETQTLLQESSDVWRAEEFDIASIHERVSNEFKELSITLGELEIAKTFGSLPEYGNQVRQRQREINKIIEDINKNAQSLIEKQPEIQAILDSLRAEYVSLVNVEDDEQLDTALANEIANSSKNKDKELKSLIAKLDKISDSRILKNLERVRDNMNIAYATNILYKTLYKSFGGVKKMDMVRDNYYDESVKYPIKSARIDDLLTFTTNDVIYEDRWMKGESVFQDDYEEIVVGDKTVRVARLTNNGTQIAFQHFISTSNLADKTGFNYDLVHFGVSYMLEKGIITEDTNKFSVGKLEDSMKGYEPVFEQLVNSMNEYVDKVDKDDNALNRLREAVYAIPFNNTTGEFYEFDGSYGITAMMHPDKRFSTNLPQMSSIIKFAKSSPNLMSELKALLGNTVVLTSKSGKDYISREIYKAMEDEEVKKKIMKLFHEAFKQYFTQLSASPFQRLKIQSFSKGFKLRAYNIDRTPFSRNFTNEDNLSDIFVIQPKGVEELKDYKRESTSKVFYGENYYGLVAARYKDGTEELLKVRNVNQSEAETVAAMLYIRFLNGNQNIAESGQWLFPNEEANKDWSKGLIQSIIRFGTSEGGQEVLKMHNIANWSKKKKAYIANEVARPYDIWMSNTDKQLTVKWVDETNTVRTILAKDIVTVVNNELVFNNKLLNFLQSKHFNVSSITNRTDKYKVQMPYLNKNNLKHMVNTQSTSGALRAFTIKEISNPTQFYAFGNEETKAVVQTSTIPNKPAHVGRKVVFKPETTVFNWKPIERKTSSNLDKKLKKLKEQDISKLPDGNYQLLSNNIVKNIRVESGKIVNSVDESAKPIIDKLEKIKSNKWKATKSVLEAFDRVTPERKEFKHQQFILHILDMFVSNAFKDKEIRDILMSQDISIEGLDKVQVQDYFDRYDTTKDENIRVELAKKLANKQIDFSTSLTPENKLHEKLSNSPSLEAFADKLFNYLTNTPIDLSKSYEIYGEQVEELPKVEEKIETTVENKIETIEDKLSKINPDNKVEAENILGEIESNTEVDNEKVMQAYAEVMSSTDEQVMKLQPYMETFEKATTLYYDYLKKNKTEKKEEVIATTTTSSVIDTSEVEEIVNRNRDKDIVEDILNQYKKKANLGVVNLINSLIDGKANSTMRNIEKNISELLKNETIKDSYDSYKELLNKDLPNNEIDKQIVLLRATLLDLKSDDRLEDFIKSYKC